MTISAPAACCWWRPTPSTDWRKRWLTASGTGGAFDLPHADTHAVVLPHATALVAPRVPGTDAQIAAALGAPAEPAAAAIAALDRRLGAPASLRELGLREDQLETAIGLVDDALSQLPDPVSRADTERLLHAAFDGASPLAELSRR